jgi:hypothetical protein
VTEVPCKRKNAQISTLARLGRSNAAPLQGIGGARVAGLFDACSFLLDVGGPGHFEAVLDALVHGTVVLVSGKGTVRFGFLSFGDFQAIAKLYSSETKHFAFRFDASFHVGFQIVSSGDSTRFQRAGKCAGQSTSEGGDNVVDRGGHGRGGFYAVVFCVTAMHAEFQRFVEAFDVRFAKRPLFLH